MKLEAIALEKWYLRGKGERNRFFAVQTTDLTLMPGTLTVLTGRSGSGKTTLMHIMAGLLTPSSGQVLADGQSLYELGDKERSLLRNRDFALIPQGAGALGTLTVMENILLPQGIFGKGMDRCERAQALLDRLGIGELADVYPRELSGGELRRVAVVRALAAAPKVIFADEPTSDLDDENMHLVLTLLREAADQGAAVFLVTHDSEALSYADVKLTMNSGVIRPLDGEQ